MLESLKFAAKAMAGIFALTIAMVTAYIVSLWYLKHLVAYLGV